MAPLYSGLVGGGMAGLFLGCVFWNYVVLPQWPENARVAASIGVGVVAGLAIAYVVTKVVRTILAAILT